MLYINLKTELPIDGASGGDRADRAEDDNTGRDADGESRGVTEELKARDQMKWVQMMNNLQNAAEETVLAELIYS